MGRGVGPVVFSELQYRPSEPSPPALVLEPALTRDDLEYVELHNPTEDTIDLNGWRLRGGVEFDFTGGLQLGPNQTVLVVPFNPESGRNADRLSAFRAHYDVAADVTLVGGYQGQLRDGGELVTLLRAEAGEAGTVTARLLEDAIAYDDQAPWPETTDLGGMSLQRTAVDAWGHAAGSWTLGEASPGTTDLSSGTLAGDANQDGSVRSAGHCIFARGRSVSDRCPSHLCPR